jgi:DNA/RNA-binding domain of Phe-tRNA-synthetase-like protein
MIDRFRISAELLAAYPSYSAVIVHAAGVANGPSDERSRERLRRAESTARERIGGRRLAEHPHIASWRAAYSSFGAKPSRYPCSAEALIKRSLEDAVPAINQLVDLYNAVSIAHVLPVGGEDFDHLSGTLELRLARGGEQFESGDEVSTVRPGEPIWIDEQGITCRRWNWRQAPRTALGEQTRNAFFVLDALAPYDAEQLDAATEELVAGLRELSPGCDIEMTRAGT